MDRVDVRYGTARPRIGHAGPVWHHDLHERGDTGAVVRLRSPDGRWTIDVIRLSLTSDHRDGEWLRVSCDGYFIAECRTLDDVRRHVDLGDFLEEALTRRQAGGQDKWLKKVMTPSTQWWTESPALLGLATIQTRTKIVTSVQKIFCSKRVPFPIPGGRLPRVPAVCTRE